MVGKNQNEVIVDGDVRYPVNDSDVVLIKKSTKNLKLIRCKIIGTQPLCYCDNLTLEDCEMIDTDLAFESPFVHVM